MRRDRPRTVREMERDEGVIVGSSHQPGGTEDRADRRALTGRASVRRHGQHCPHCRTQPVGLLLRPHQRRHRLPRPAQFPPRHRPVTVRDALQQCQGRRGVLSRQPQLALLERDCQPHVLRRHLGNREPDWLGALDPDEEALLRIGHAQSLPPAVLVNNTSIAATRSRATVGAGRR
jgi:hypothetical protein